MAPHRWIGQEVRRSRTLMVAAAIAVIIALSAQSMPGSSGAVSAHKYAHQASEETNSSKSLNRENPNTFAMEQYDNRAYPQGYVSYEQVVRSRAAAAAIPGPTLAQSWLEIGPFHPKTSAQATYTGRETTNSGRLTSLVIAPGCNPTTCRVWVGASGGGVWRTDRALGAQPTWISASSGLTSTAIGSLVLDANDPTSNTLYAGTGEPNGSSDSEAGVGLFKSTNGGQSWTLIQGSIPYSKDRSIGSVAIEPGNANHIVMGTAVARHGVSSVNGGRRTPPGAPPVGIYDSIDGGATWQSPPPFPLPQDAAVGVNPPDFFRGGVTKIRFDRTGLAAGQPARIFASVFDYGVYRSTDDGQTYTRIFDTEGGPGNVANSSTARTEFALAPLPGGGLRMYVGDCCGPGDNVYPQSSNLFRSDNADAPAPNFTQLSANTPGNPPFDSYDFCEGQCSYDMFVESPPGQPDTVLLGGSAHYNEIFVAHRPSNGRMVVRSTDAGVSFRDMTNDSELGPCTPFPNNVPPCPEGMHPDQHALVFNPSNPNQFWAASDGGLIRNDGTFTDISSQCDQRGLSGADYTDCQRWLSAVPTYLYKQNDTLRTLQFGSLSVNPKNPLYDALGGTQDNGTWSFVGGTTWAQTVGGDGGNSGIDPVNADTRVHTYYNAQVDVNFNGNDPNGWDWIADPLQASGESQSFYVPLEYDPILGGSIFTGLQHVWRTQDSGGDPTYLNTHCNELTGDFSVTCGDWKPIGVFTLTGTHYGTDRRTYGTSSANYVVQTHRTPADTNTMWAATRPGRIFISHNVNDPNPDAVTFTRIDNRCGGVAGSTTCLPGRFPSGISIDPANTNHAWISYSGYGVFTPSAPGHVYEVTYNPATQSTTTVDRSYNLGDQPILSVRRDHKTGDLYVSGDWGVYRLPAGSTTWQQAANGLPPVATYGLTMNVSHRVLYAATHGRGAFRLYLP